MKKINLKSISEVLTEKGMKDVKAGSGYHTFISCPGGHQIRCFGQGTVDLYDWSIVCGGQRILCSEYNQPGNYYDFDVV